MTQGIEIDSRQYWNATGLNLVKGQRYSFTTEGQWSDASHLCDANGWVPEWGKPWDWLLSLKRVPTEGLFKLIGSVNKTEPYMSLGKNGSFVSPASGELFCFANDVPFFYWNNTGKVKLFINPV